MEKIIYVATAQISSRFLSTVAHACTERRLKDTQDAQRCVYSGIFIKSAPKFTKFTGGS